MGFSLQTALTNVLKLKEAAEKAAAVANVAKKGATPTISFFPALIEAAGLEAKAMLSYWDWRTANTTQDVELLLKTNRHKTKEKQTRKGGAAL